MFRIFINDSEQCASEANFVSYADDTVMLIKGHTSYEIDCKENAALLHLTIWAEISYLKMNTNRTMCEHFRPRNCQIIFLRITRLDCPH